MAANATKPVRKVAPPEWVQLCPAGTFRGKDGRGPYTLRDPAAVVTAIKRKLPLVLDEMHATDLGGSTEGNPAPARGWIVAVEARSTGIWGQVEWTKEGAELVSDRAYRGISPALVLTKDDGSVLGIERASLTNLPNLPVMTLHAELAPMLGLDRLLARLRDLLGLADDADENEIIVAVQNVMADREMHGAGQGWRARHAAADATVIRVMGIDRSAYTATKARTALHAVGARMPSSGDLLAALIKLLGLPDDADEAACIEAVEKLCSAEDGTGPVALNGRQPPQRGTVPITPEDERYMREFGVSREAFIANKRRLMEQGLIR